MYRCEECGAIFETAESWKEYRGECFGYPAYETVSGCPCCHSTDVEEYEPEDEEREEEDESEEEEDEN